MATKTILILGGYGETGKVLCSYLLLKTNVAIVIAGRRLLEAKRICAELKKSFPNRSVSAVFADAADYQSLITVFEDIDLIIDATSAVNFISNVAKAALEVKADYLDYHFDQNVLVELEKLKPEIENSGQIFITQAGFHPGLPAAFVRFSAMQFDELKVANVGMAMNARIEKPESIYELVDTIADYKVDIFKKRKWQRAGYKDFKKFYFGTRFGNRTCFPIQLAEMKILPKMFPLEETGVYVAGFNWFADYFVFPLAFILFAFKKGLGRHLIAKLFTFSFNHISGDARGVSLVVEAEGMNNGRTRKFRLAAEHNDAYAFTVIPIIACVKQYLRGDLKSGLWMMGHLVDPDRLIQDMEAMGIAITAYSVAST
jgi:saccharopine dehydrogenase (NAD+, L-lysine-forming)